MRALRVLALRARTPLRRAADPWAILLAIAVAALGFAFEVHPLLWIAGALAVLVVHRFAEVGSAGTAGPPGGLTRREVEIVCRIGEGATDREIASGLALTEGTVEDYVRHARKKLGLRNRDEIGRWYRRNRGAIDKWRPRPAAPTS